MPLPVRRRQDSPRAQTPWEPFRELEQLQEDTARLLESVLAGDPKGAGAAWAPLVDIEETDDAWILEAELPGVKSDDVNVDIRDNEIEVSGDIKERPRLGILRRRARRTGRFEYRVTLPGPVDPSDVDAKLEHGVLELRIPKPEAARSRRVEVSTP
jgi:HSP20 family protein